MEAEGRREGRVRSRSLLGWRERLAVYPLWPWSPGSLATRRALGACDCREGRGPRLTEVCRDEKPEAGP